MVDMEQVQVFERAVKRNISEGKGPEEAVARALDETGLPLSDERKQLLIRALKLSELQARDPTFIARANALDAAVRKLWKSGMPVKQAVIQAQADTGVQLGEQGQAMLIRMLEEERARLEGTTIEVVSDKEFAEMQANAKCVPVVPPGTPIVLPGRSQLVGSQAGWLCCRCNAQGRGTVNPTSTRSCKTCNHERCDLQ